MDYEKLLFERSASTLKVHGILAIVFGGLGTLVGIVMAIAITIGGLSNNYNSYNSSSYADSAFGLFFLGLLLFIFWILPHVYLIVSGYYLTRQPSPKLAKTLVIINLVIGVFWNLVLLIFAIINLTEIGDYERGYHVHKKHVHYKA
jgi:hypothetical protein